jgi:hypothetical protein
VSLTLHVESSAPDEALEQLYAHLAEDRDFFNEVFRATSRVRRVRERVDPVALSTI